MTCQCPRSKPCLSHSCIAGALATVTVTPNQFLRRSQAWDSAKRSKKSQEAVEKMMKSSSKDSAPSKPKGPTAAELEAQRKAAALAKRKAEGQKVRKKFEKEKGERRIALRKRYMKLLKLT